MPNEDATIERDTNSSVVSSIVLFGDPSYVRDASYSRGTGDRDGVSTPHDASELQVADSRQIFEREDESRDRCNVIGSRVVSYCDEGDWFCGTSIFSINSTVHVSYVDIYGDDVVDLVVAAYKNFTPEFSHERSGLAELDPEDEGAASMMALSPVLAAVPLVVMGLFHLL